MRSSEERFVDASEGGAVAGEVFCADCAAGVGELVGVDVRF